MRGDVFTVLSTPLKEIEVGATGLREIAQNVQTILATIRGTLFLDRTFGVNGEIVDLPMPTAMARYTSEVIQEVERQEPRVQVVSVEFDRPNPTTDAGDGKLLPRVTLRVREGVLL